MYICASPWLSQLGLALLAQINCTIAKKKNALAEVLPLHIFLCAVLLPSSLWADVRTDNAHYDYRRAGSTRASISVAAVKSQISQITHLPMAGDDLANAEKPTGHSEPRRSIVGAIQTKDRVCDLNCVGMSVCLSACLS